MRRTAILCRSFLGCFAVLPVITCAESPRIDDAERHLLLAADQPEDSVSPLIRQRQQRLLRALTDATADPTPDMAEDFTMVDRGNPAGGRRRRDLDGRYRAGLDRWKVLAQRLPARYADVQEMEVILQRLGRGSPPAANHAVVIVRHGAVRPTITRWTRTGEEWKAMSLTINVPEDLIAQVREHARRGS